MKPILLQTIVRGHPFKVRGTELTGIESDPGSLYLGGVEITDEDLERGEVDIDEDPRWADR